MHFFFVRLCSSALCGWFCPLKFSTRPSHLKPYFRSPPPPALRPHGQHTDTRAFHARAAHRTRPTRQLTLSLKRHGTPRAHSLKNMSYTLYYHDTRTAHTSRQSSQSRPPPHMSHLPCVVYTVSWPHASPVRWPHTATHCNTQHTI